MTEQFIHWTKELGSKIIKEIKIEIASPEGGYYAREIPSAFISQTQKICLKCNQKFIYERTDEVEKFFRQFSSLKKGNLDLCFNCDD
jgi:hypothetical protein